MRAFLFMLFIGSSFLATGCATTNGEPTAHVEQCHVERGKIVDNASCISDHNTIVSERDARERERRLTRAIDRSSRR